MTKKRKRSIHKVVIGELLFWFHAVVVLLMLLAGLLISFWWVVLITILHRVQLIVFHGCIITQMESREGAVRKGTAFYHVAIKRFFGVSLNHRQVRVLSITISIATLVIAAVATKYNFRLWNLF
ncbi:MAG TPA: hypothetical protein VFW90_03425 [Candidatus Saccharimonadales bacterium]|nr:hypothetical protein [Candidatus Saccharimonadales bacterium]